MDINRILAKVSLAVAVPLAYLMGIVWPSESQASDAFLWEVESPENTVYLLGSIHFLRETDYPLPESIQRAFEESETVVFEADLSASESFDTVETIFQIALPDTPEESLANALDADTYRLAEAAAASLGLPMQGVDSFEPWFFFTGLSGLKLMQLGFEPDYGIDSYFFEQATLANKNIRVFETVEEQLNFLDKLSIDVQVEIVEQTISDLETLSSSTNLLVDAWKTGNVTDFENLILEGFADFPEAYDALLVQRNQNWLTDIESFINQSEDYLVIVGAAHLVGEDSVVKLLQDKGHTVEQLGSN
ncbi:MAG: TraB/GumN family protein [Cyanobacteria bacterium P01_H01_bin.58]